MATPEGAEKITEERAAEALQQLTVEDLGEQETPVEVVEQSTEPVETAPVEAKEGDAKKETGEKTATETVKAAAEDDVASLKTRLEDAEKSAKEREEHFTERHKASQERHAESTRILQDRYIRKSTAADRALKIIEAAQTDTGVDPVEAKRVVEELKSTMHPESASYAPPVQRAEAVEDQQVVINSFLNEKDMTVAEGDKFGLWIKTESHNIMSPIEQAKAHTDLDGFLRFAHISWKEDVDKKNDKQVGDAVGAVKAVKQVQKAAARAASATTTAPKKQVVTKSTGTDVKKLTDNDVSALFKASVEEHL